MSLAPDKRVFPAVETADLLLLFCSVSNMFKYLSLARIPAHLLVKMGTSLFYSLVGVLYSNSLLLPTTCTLHIRDFGMYHAPVPSNLH
jgi:hypothetical protein